MSDEQELRERKEAYVEALEVTLSTARELLAEAPGLGMRTGCLTNVCSELEGALNCAREQVFGAKR